MANSQRLRALRDCQQDRHCRRDAKVTAERKLHEKLCEKQEKKQEQPIGHIIGHSDVPTQNQAHLRRIN
jgi:hypothetical protein